MLFKVKVRETLIHEIIVEAESAEEAETHWMERFGDSDFDEIVAEHEELMEVEEDD